MAHGVPDWWGAAPQSTTYGLQDMAELAVRLGAISTHDRRGNVIFWDDFSEGIARVYTSGTGAGYEAYPSLSAPLSSGVGLYLVTGDAVDNLAWMSKELPYPVLSKIGVECAFVTNANLKYLKLRVFEYLAASRNEYSVRYAHQSGKIQALDSDGAWYDVSTPGQLYEGYNDYAVFKMVIDLLAGVHVRTIFNEHAYITSAYAPQNTLGAHRKSIGVDVEITTNAAANLGIAVDNFIITQNEP